jgi:ABC-type nitrate/sulfonate/bicarbonate transport system substrate-binding protein
MTLISACRNQSENKKAVGKLTFALPVADWWTAAPFIVAETVPFSERGLDLKTLEVNSGLASKNAVVAGTADIGLSAATPLALAAANNEQLVILGTYLQSSQIIGLVRPRDMPANSLPPEPVAIVPSTISEWSLYEYLSRLGKQQLMEQKQLKELQLRPADIPGSLKTGAAKSAVIWEPFLSLSANQSGFIVDRAALQYPVSLYIITRPAVLHNRPDAIKAFLQGVEDACHRLSTKSDESRLKVEGHFGFSTNFLASTWPMVTYHYAFDRSMMTKEIIRDSDIAKKLGYISEIPKTDYLFPQEPPLQQR